MRDGWRRAVLLCASVPGLGACSSTPPAPTATPRAEAAPPQVPAPPTETPAPAPPAPEGAPPPPAPAQVPAEGPTSKEPAKPAGILLSGTVSFADGTVPKVFLFFLVQEGSRRIGVSGKAGRFERRIPAAGTYRMGGFIADGVLHAYLPEELDVEEGKEIRILLEEERPAAILAVDEATGAPLPGARARRSRFPALRRHEGPYPRYRRGEAETLRDDGKGRIDLGPGRGVEEVWVVAAGRAWTLARVPHTPGGDVPVRLPPGGSLRLEVPGWSALENASLYMEFESGADCLMPSPGPTGEILLGGLPCETLSFEIRRGGSPSARPALGSGTVSIRAGEEASLTLEPRPTGATRAVRVRGSVTFHPGWGDPKGVIVFRGADESNADIEEMVDLLGAATDGRRIFAMSRLTPGRYRVEVAQWRTEVTVPAKGGKFDFTIPEPAEVRVRVVADETGEVLRGARLSWYRPEESLPSWSSESAAPDRKTGEFLLHVLPGPLALTASAPGRVDLENQDYEHLTRGTPEYPTYGPGEKAEVTLRLVRGGSVRVRLRCDGAPVSGAGLSVNLNMWPGGRGSRSGISAYGMQGKQDTFTKDGVPPGLRSITIEDEKGLYEEVPETEVEVVAGETAEVTLDLVRSAPRAPVPTVEGILRVVDEETGKPIPGAKLFRVVEEPRRRAWRHEPVPESSKPGEFRFRGPPGIAYFGVEAPGHVTQNDHPGLPLEVLASVPLEHEFRVPRAGEVLVTFKGGGNSFHPESAWIRRGEERMGGGWTAMGLEVIGDRAREVGLAPGPYTIEVKPGRGFERVPDREVEVRAGEVTEVVVDLVARTPEADAARSVRGTVTFHPGWGGRESEVRFRGVGGSNDDIEEKVPLAKTAPGRPVSFAIGILPPGRYRVEVQPQWATEVEVTEEGGTFDFTIPEPAEILVRVVAEETGKPLSGSRLHWYSRSEDLSDRVGFALSAENGDETPKAGEYRFLAPPGALDVRASAPGRSEVSLALAGPGGEYEPLTVRSGERVERTIRLPSAGTVRVLLRCDGRLLDRREADPWLIAGNRPDGGDGAFSWCMNGSGGSLTYDGIPPGKHTLEIRDPEGRFEPVPDREVQVRGGETTEVAVDLVRRK